MRVRLEDVARAAGVSPKTVSRVLNDEANVRAPTREKVLAAMAAMDYRPHQPARSLASNRSFLIAMLYDNPSSNYLTEIQAGVLEACDQHHYSMMMRPLRMEDGDFLERVDRLISHLHPDGLVLTPPITDHPALLQRLRERLPAMDSGLLVDRHDRLVSRDALPAPVARLLHDYRLVQYDLSTGRRYSEDAMFAATG
jgi:LacI family transcriptional regulator